MTRDALRGIARRKPNSGGWVSLSRQEMADLVTAAGYGHNADYYRHGRSPRYECHPAWVQEFVLMASRGARA